MQIRAEEISQIIRKEIDGFDQKVAVSETGTVLEAGDGIARVYGLESAMAGELLEGATIDADREESARVAARHRARHGGHQAPLLGVAATSLTNVSTSRCWSPPAIDFVTSCSAILTAASATSRLRVTSASLTC